MKKKARPLLAVALLIVIVVAIALVTKVVKKYTPSQEVMDSGQYFGLQDDGQVALVVHDRVSAYKGILAGDVCYVDFGLVKTELNDRFYWDGEANLLRYTTPSDIIEVAAGSSQYAATGRTESVGYEIVKTQGQSVYLALDFVKQFTALDYTLFSEPNRAVITNEFGEKEVARVRKKTKLRLQGGIKSPILRELSKNETVTVLETMEDWTGVVTEDGYYGYLPNKRLADQKTETTASTFEEPVYESIRKNYKINMVWHVISNMDANYGIIYDIAAIKGVNTISPTWFTILDNEGNLQSLALSDYVETAHRNGMEVWPLIDNFGAGVDTTKVLSATVSRDRIENQLIASAIEFGFDGINVDFESVPEEAADGYIQFLRELSVKCRANGLALSVDVPVPMPFSAHYNRKELGTVCDYVVIMGYDEHYSGSDAGSVASLGFENQGILDTLKEVPAEKIISGIPFYTRLWNTVTHADGTTSVTSEAMGMQESAQRLENNDVKPSWDEATGQNYAEFTGDDGSLYQIWMEDDKSIGEKMKLVSDYGLAGVAIWRLGFENETVWDVILKYL